MTTETQNATEIKTPAVEIPAEIVAPNHRKAYAMAYVAGFTGRKLAFVAPVVRNSIVRGYLTGEQHRAQAEAIATAALMVDKFTGEKFHTAHA
jgi:hypothetical protein